MATPKKRMEVGGKEISDKSDVGVKAFPGLFFFFFMSEKVDVGML